MAVVDPWHRHSKWKCQSQLHSVQDGAGITAMRTIQDDRDGAMASNVVVARPWRGLGVGKLLMRTLVAEATALGAARLYAQVDTDNLVRPLQAPAQCYLQTGFLRPSLFS